MTTIIVVAWIAVITYVLVSILDAVFRWKYEGLKAKKSQAEEGLELIYSASGQEHGTPETVIDGIQHMRLKIDELICKLTDSEKRIDNIIKTKLSLARNLREADDELDEAKKGLQAVVNTAAHPDVAFRSVMVDLAPVRKAIERIEKRQVKNGYRRT